MEFCKKSFLGELIGTFVLVFFGTGVVGISIINPGWELYQIAMVWCLAVMLGIFASNHLSNSHLNPAVSIAMLLAGNLPKNKLSSYLLGQFAGAFLASCVLYILLGNNLDSNNLKHARMFGEFYAEETGIWRAAFAEMFGTFLLVFMIFRLTTKENNHKALTPFFIGLVVAAIICIIAPITQAGLNPARDFAPRLFSFIAGWGKTVFTTPDSLGWLAVYIVAPILGGIGAVAINKNLQN